MSIEDRIAEIRARWSEVAPGLAAPDDIAYLLAEVDRLQVEVERLNGLFLGDVLDPIHNPIRKERDELRAERDALQVRLGAMEAKGCMGTSELPGMWEEADLSGGRADSATANQSALLDAMTTEWGVRYADFPDEISRRRGEDVVQREMTLCRKHGVDATPVRREVTPWREAES